MSRKYLVTGAAGFLGSTVCRQLVEEGADVRAFVLPNDPAAKYIPESVEVVEGDLCDKKSLEPFFAVEDGVHGSPSCGKHGNDQCRLQQEIG